MGEVLRRCALGVASLRRKRLAEVSGDKAGSRKDRPKLAEPHRALPHFIVI